jgi:hypothetical protein
VGRALLGGMEGVEGAWTRPVTVSLRRSGSGVLAYREVVTLDARDGFMLDDLAPGVYDVELRTEGALGAVRQGMTLGAGLNIATVGPLAVGDIVPDGHISARDWLALTQAFSSARGEERYNPAADLDGDGRIDLRDVSILATNYGRVGLAVHDDEPGDPPPPVQNAVLRAEFVGDAVRVGESIACQVVLDSGSNVIGAVDLELVLPDGLDLQHVVALAPLSQTLPWSALDGAGGRLRYAAVDLAQPVSGTVPLLELTFVAQDVLGQAGGTPAPHGMRLGVAVDGASRVLSVGGEDVLAATVDATVLVRHRGELFLPMIWRGLPHSQTLSSSRREEGGRDVGAPGAILLPMIGQASIPVGSPSLPPIEARDVYLHNGYTYMALASYWQGSSTSGWGRYLVVDDVRDPRNPQRVAFVDGISREVDRIWVDGERAYAANRHRGAMILDLSTPPLASPAVIGAFHWQEPGRQHPIAKGLHALTIPGVGPRLYVADEEYGLQVVDVSTPQAPRLLGKYDRGEFAENVWVANNIAYVASDYPGVRIVDVSDPARPRALQPQPIPVTGRSVDVQVEGNRLYVAAEHGGVTVLDISHPSQPVLLGQITTTFARKLTVSDDIVYLADDRSGLLVIDASNPAAMRVIARGDPGDRAFGVSVGGGYAYVAAGTAGLRVFDLSPLTPTPTPTATATPTVTPSLTATPTPSPTVTPTPTATPISIALPLVLWR